MFHFVKSHGRNTKHSRSFTPSPLKLLVRLGFLLLSSLPLILHQVHHPSFPIARFPLSRNCTCRLSHLMQSTQNVPSDSNIPLSSFHTDTISSSTQLDPSAAALQKLQAAIQTANDTKSSLVTQLHTLRQSLHSSFHSISTEHQTQTKAVERAARSLAVRAMELDNRALDLDNRESNFHASLSQYEARHAHRQRTLDQASRQVVQKETALLAREASLKYSAVEQMRLHAWSRELEKREARLGEAESAEKERIAARVAAVTRRELLVAEKETHLDTVMRQREADVLKREKAVEAVAHALERQRSEALLQIEAERSQFWTHQQKLSAVVAAETETLLSEQANLRRQFEVETHEAKLALRQMLEQVAAMKKLVDEADTSNNNDSTDIGDDEHILSEKLETLAIPEGRVAQPKQDEKNDTTERTLA